MDDTERKQKLLAALLELAEQAIRDNIDAAEKLAEMQSARSDGVKQEAKIALSVRWSAFSQAPKMIVKSSLSTTLADEYESEEDFNQRKLEI